MTKQIFFVVFIIASTFSVSAAEKLSVDDIIQNHIDARGGLNTINSINTVQVTGKMYLAGHGGGHGHDGGGSLPISIDYQIKQPSMRFEFEMQGKASIRTYDGKKGWLRKEGGTWATTQKTTNHNKKSKRD